MFYVYRHIRLDTNEPFYIGMGVKPKYYKKFEREYQRAFSKEGRSKFWHNIVSKTEYKIDILFDNLTQDLAKKKEIEFINLYGRRDLNEGTLVNLTNGGDGNSGGVINEETRKKLSEAHKGEKTVTSAKKVQRIIHMAKKVNYIVFMVNIIH